MFALRGYEWIFEGDIAACFDEIDHTALMERLRRRVGDRRVLHVVKAFLKAGLLDEAGTDRETVTGTPQGGILSPLLANLALSALDDYFVDEWQRVSATHTDRTRLRRHGLPTFRLVRYADDFVVLVHGTREQAESLWGRVAAVLDTVGLRLTSDKTKVVHIDEGFDFLGFRIKRDVKRGGSRRYIYTYPSRKAVAAIMRKVKEATRQAINDPLSRLLRHLNLVLQGWANYFRHGSSWDTFAYLGYYAWLRVGRWMRRKHPHRSWRWLRKRYSPNHRWHPEQDGVTLLNPATTKIVRYRYRGAVIPSPWPRPGATI